MASPPNECRNSYAEWLLQIYEVSFMMNHIVYAMNNRNESFIHGLQGKKIVVWGASKLLELYIKNSRPVPISYVVDSNPLKYRSTHCGFPVYAPEELQKEKCTESVIILFPVSNLAIQDMLEQLHPLGFRLYENVFLYSDLFYESFNTRFEKICGRKVNWTNYEFAIALTLRTKIPTHTTILGNVLFIELLAETLGQQGSIAEIGSYSGGNAWMSLLWMTQHGRANTPFYIADSFEGFPEISRFDPNHKKRGDYKIDGTFESVLDTFAIFPNANIVKGFVPDIFKQFGSKTNYSVVLYDCDLYEPAVATFEYFWERILPGGFLMVHDYVAEDGGYTGVKKATDEFFKGQEAEVHIFWENTSALIRKK